MKHEDPETAKKYGKIGFGLLLLIILVAGMFWPAALSGIPLLWAFVTFLGGINIIAGVTALLIAIVANIAYILWELPVSLIEKIKEFKEKHL